MSNKTHKPTPYCFVCGRWDGTHSAGCPRSWYDYKKQGTNDGTTKPSTIG